MTDRRSRRFGGGRRPTCWFAVMVSPHGAGVLKFPTLRTTTMRPMAILSSLGRSLRPATDGMFRTTTDLPGRSWRLWRRIGPILLPASTGFAGTDQPDGPVVNLSYWIFPAFRRLRALSDAIDWDGLTATGKTLIGLSRFGPRRLPSNWISVAGAQPEPAYSFPAVFGYDAVRIPLYLAWGEPGDRDLLKSFLPLDLSVIDVKTASPGQRLSDPDYGAIANLAECVGSHSPVQWKAVHGEFYYPATLYLLALIAVDELSEACPR
jgi:endo-1,4-beta-D-glucanase Y